MLGLEDKEVVDYLTQVRRVASLKKRTDTYLNQLRTLMDDKRSLENLVTPAEAYRQSTK